MAASPRIITRGDDLGSYRAALPAFQEGVASGFLKSVGVMTCGLWFEETVEWLRGLDGVDIGLHFCLNAEFYSPKWGPVGEGLMSLVGEDGFFTPAPIDLHRKGFLLEDVLRELEAQFNRLVDSGIPCHYIDDHMGVTWLEGLRDGVTAFAEKKGVLFATGCRYVPYDRSSPLADQALDQFVKLENDGALWVLHPALDGEEMRGLCYEGAEPGQVARERDEDRIMMSDPRLLAGIQAGLWQPIRWTEGA